MKKPYLQTQDIFNKVFENRTNTLKATMGYHSTQDYINAVFDANGDALRINVAGGVMPAVGSSSELPETATENSICPVVQDGGFTLYQYNNGKWTALSCSTASGEASLPEEQRAAVNWLTENLTRIQEMATSEYVVRTEVLTLEWKDGEPVVLSVQGAFQNISDTGDTDGDESTTYRIDISGYVLGIENYPQEDAISTDRYYTKMVYEPVSGAAGISHIYMDEEEYRRFASFSNGRNILKVFYISNVFPGSVSVREVSVDLPYADAEQVIVDVQGNVQDITDSSDADGDPATHYRIRMNGYVLDIEAFESQEAPQASRFFAKMSYDSNANVTSVFFTREEYDVLSSYTDGKNRVEFDVLDHI